MRSEGDEVCLLSAVERNRWEYHGQPPARCNLRKHQHISEADAREMCRNGDARLALIAGRWRLLQTNIKKGWQPRMSAGFTVNQLTNS